MISRTIPLGEGPTGGYITAMPPRISAAGEPLCVSRRTFALSIAGSAALHWPGALGQGAPVALILYDGDVHVVDRAFRRVEAIAIGGGRVMAAGTTAEVRRLAGPRTESINLRGRTVLPGANDTHLHALLWGYGQPPFTVDVSYPTVRSIADVVGLVAQAAASRGAGQWIRGNGWDQRYFAEGRAPTRQDLDRVAPDHPVALNEFSFHAVWANSKALALAGITRETVPPTGGVIVKDAAGEPTGVLLEDATSLIYRAIPPYSAAERRQGFDNATRLMASNGITSFTEPLLDGETIAFFAEMAAAGALKARLTALLGVGDTVAELKATLGAFRMPADLDPRWVRVAGVKIVADGIPTNNKTAWLHQPYQGGGNGELLVGEGGPEQRMAELEGMIVAAHEAGWQIGTHATGDKTIDVTVDAYAKALAKTPDRNRRHYLIHADLASPATLRRMATLGIGANFNSTIKYLIADGQVASIGPERASFEWPYRTAIDAGVVVATGSDAPVTDGNWRQGLATCVTRKGKQTGNVSGPAERISLDQAIWSHTAAGAWQDRAETWKGTLAQGMAGDLVVLDGGIGRVEPEAIGAMKVDLTVVDGRVVFQR
jgi:predicted amidohydrolase YtcJ